MSCSDLFQANLIILKQTQSNQANDNVNDNANENDSVSVNANAMPAQCAVWDPLDPCAARAARHTHSSPSLSAKRSGDQAAAFCVISAR